MGKPKMIMLMGIPGSGKSTLARHIHIADGEIRFSADVNDTGYPHIHSSDALRGELYGDEATQGDNNALFLELHRRIRDDLRSGKDVVYDATNINKKQRISFLDELKNIDCEKVCIAVMTPFKMCVENNSRRERKVPERVIRKMFKSWQPPHFHEGFDIIHFAFLEYDRKYFDDLTKAMDGFDQENSHHTLTLGEHCRKAAQYCIEKYPDDHNLHTAAYLHDIGKLCTKVRKNFKGEDDGECHYYQHHCVGAYEAMFYLACNDGRLSSHTIEDQCDIINMIYYHMHPYGAWKQSEKAMERDKRLIGDELFHDIMLLHEADLWAH